MLNMTSNIALSGMSAAQTRMDVSAHNIANLQTEGFVRQEVTQREQPGSTGTIASVNRNANGEGADVTSELIYQLKAKNDFMANAFVLKIGLSTLGSLLDIKA